MSVWSWISASVIGTSHIKGGTRKQDAFRCFCPEGAENYFVSVVSDGAGSTNFGGQGASISCRYISTEISSFLKLYKRLPNDDEFMSWIDHVRDLIYLASLRKNTTPREFSATLQVVVTNGEETLSAQIGDGCSVFRGLETQRWFIPKWPDHGEYASTTYFITDEVKVNCSISRFSIPIDSVVSFTDGIERLALDFVSQQPHDGFFDVLARPVHNSQAIGKDFALTSELEKFLSGSSVCSRTDDDKTLVVAARK